MFTFSVENEMPKVASMVLGCCGFLPGPGRCYFLVFAIAMLFSGVIIIIIIIIIIKIYLKRDHVQF